MKICLFSDVHGNIAALQALMKTEDWLTADKRIFLGDIINICPFPVECAETLFASDSILLMGNHESYTFGHIHPKESFMRTPERYQHLVHTRKLLSPEMKKKLASLPKELVIEWCGKKLLFTHYVWACNFMTIPAPFEKIYDNDETLALFADVEADYVFYGHDHFPAQFGNEKKKLIGVGSLGVSKPGFYVMLDLRENGEIHWEWKRIDYDYQKLIAQMQDGSYPGCETYVEWFEHINMDCFQKRLPF